MSHDSVQLRRPSARDAALALLPLIVALGGVAAAQAPATDPAQPLGASTPPLRALSNAEVERYVAALDELVDINAGVEKRLVRDPAQASQAAATLATDSKMVAALASHGFDPQSFTDTHWNVLAAYTALSMRGHEAEMAQARQQLEQMKTQLPPAQYEMMMQSMQGVTAWIDTAQNVPPENVKLVERHRAELDAVLKRKQ